MASGTVPPPTGIDRPQAPPQPTESERFIDRRLRQTRRQVKRVDVWAGLIALAAGALTYLLAAAILDHWLIPGGLGFAGRLILFLILVLAAGLYVVVYLGPRLIHRVNPVFAAYSIEQSRPSLKNSLINLLFLRRDRPRIERDALARGIYQAMERKAAHDLEQIPVEVAVDRSRVIRLGYTLAAILALACLYLVLSPKSSLASFHRVLWPWADVKAPTRVTIEEVQPGDEVVYQGDVVAISAKVDGLDEDEQAMLYYSTAGGQSVDQAVPLTVAEGEFRHRCELPPGQFGLQQDVEYYLAAGDCRTRRFQLEVETALSILVETVEYDYPEYTGIPDRIDQRIADLKAIEGTRVAIRAAANQPIARAFLDMDCDPRHALRMTVDGPSRAAVSFTLMLDPNDPTRPEHASYHLRFADTSGRENRAPIRQRIEVVRDLAPEIRFEDPPATDIELPENGVLALQVRAQDPDFALRHVALRAECSGRDLGIAPWLDKASGRPPHEGPFQGTYRFVPARLGLKAGDRVIYWAEAEDNMRWEEDRNSLRPESRVGPGASRPPNRAETARRWITITPPDAQWRPDENREAGSQKQDQDPGKTPEQPKDPPPEQPQTDEQKQGPSEQDPSGEQGGPSGTESATEQDAGQTEAGQQGEGQGGTPSETSQGSPQQTGSQPGGQSTAPREPIDQTNPGDAFDEILQHINEQEQKQDGTGGSAGSQDPQGESQPDQPPSGPQRGDASAQQGGQPSGGEPSTDGQQPTGAQDTPPSSRQPPSQGGTDSSGTDQPVEQRMPDNKPSASEGPGPSPQPQDGQGAQAKGPGEPTEEEPTGQSPESPDARGGDPQETKGQGGAGRTSNQQTGSPSPQEANQQRKKQIGEGDQSNQGESESPQSPSTSPKDSDSQGDTSGDRSGGGEQGGGQRAKQSGTGTAGTHTASEQGGSQSDQQGEGPTGPEAGDQAPADRPTGRPADQGEGPGSSQRRQPGAQRPGQGPEGQNQQTTPAAGPTQPDQAPTGPSQGPSGSREGSVPSGDPVAGGNADGRREAAPPSEPGTYRPEDPNLEYAREAVNLALEHLEDQLSKEEPDQDLLDRLGWTKDDLKRLYEQWDRMRREAAQQGDRGESARGELDKALRSLGLQAPGTVLQGGRSGVDRPGNLGEGLRIEPPPEWAEAYRAFRLGVASGPE